MDRPLLLSLDFSFFIYRNPAWPCPLPMDLWSDGAVWRRRVAQVHRETGRNIRAASNVVLTVDDVPFVQPENFFAELADKNILIPDETRTYASSYQRYGLSIAEKIVEKFSTKPDIVHFGTMHGMGKNNPAHWEHDACSFSWLRHLLEKNLVNQATIVFPDWQRKFGSVGGLMPGDSDVRRLPDTHAPVRGVWYSEWAGFVEPKTVTTLYLTRQSATTPPWVDDRFGRFMDNIRTQTFRGIGCDTPSSPRPWSDAPLSQAEVAVLENATKRALLPEPSGIVVDFNGRPLRVA